MRGKAINHIVGAFLLMISAVGQAHPMSAKLAETEIVSDYVGFSERNEARFISSARQLVFEGLRSGEGYFHESGNSIVFQSERHPENPFYQIYKMNLLDGETELISTGVGQTTCAWIHPSHEKYLFASTHLDPLSVEKQREEYERRERGEGRGYSWNFDPEYEIFVKTEGVDALENITNTLGYDAEASYSPNGEWIAFASNRIGYTGELSEEEQAIFDKDQSYGMEIYLMRKDGSEVSRLTNSAGYDGGPFFSADGTKITWRKFTPDGRTAEIWTMNLDGSGKKQLTALGKMSWAPYFHPNGEYIIFATNVHGHRNFELYMVRTDGQDEPVRVTETEGFDGLPVFSPQGDKLLWTSSRTESGKAQLFIADWDDFEARAALGLGVAAPSHDDTTASINEEDMKQHINYLASEALGGRNTGSEGERLAGEYIQAGFEKAGLLPMGDKGTFVESFTFTAGVSLGEGNQFKIAESELQLNTDYRPLSFSSSKAFDFSEIVFAGYGMRVPEENGSDGYDSYFHLDVENKWVMIFRNIPNNISNDQRRRFNRYADLRRKVKWARDIGAKGLLIVSGPLSPSADELVPMSFDAAAGASSLPIISITNAVAERLLAGHSKNLRELQEDLDNGDLVAGFAKPVEATTGAIEIVTEEHTGRNIIAMLPANSPEPSTSGAIMIGAHYDHLGAFTGRGRTSEDGIFVGADDNASGTAGVLEIAQHLAYLVKSCQIALKKDVIFAAWSGEEIGLIGSAHFVKKRMNREGSLYSSIGAYLNMDMIGRLDNKLTVQGVGSSSQWKALIEQSNVPVGLSLNLSIDPYLPTDSTSFYVKKVPILSAFTGAHDDYHTPGDTPDKIVYDGAVSITTLMANITKKLAVKMDSPDYVRVPDPNRGGGRFSVYLGTIPDYEGRTLGVLLTGVRAESPAEKAGLKAGDIIVELDGEIVENIHDYTFALSGLRPNVAVSIKIKRGEELLTLEITPASRS